MAGIIIDIRDNCFIILGDIERITNDRRAKSNFKSIGASFEHSNQVTLNFDAGNDNEVHEDLIRLLKRFRIDDYEYTASAEDHLQDILRREKSFDAFSKKAKDIRNNKHEGNDFENFTTTVAGCMIRHLYTLQLLSAYHLAFAQNACNFSVPGSGKTSIVYATYAYLKSLPVSNYKHVERMLVICPLSAFGPWKNEYEECFGEAPRVKELVGLSARSRANYFIDPGDTELTLISYQSASSDIQYIKNFLRTNGNVMVVLDEAHKIKNTDEEAVWSNAILSIADYAKARIVLTGTPAPNGYEDLWNLYKFIWPHRYENIIGFPQPYLRSLGDQSKDKEEFIENIAPFFIRIKKSDLNLPNPVFNEPIMVPMAPDQKRIYEHIERNYILSFEREGERFSTELRKAKTMRLRQCLTNPMLLKKPLSRFQEDGIVSVNDREILKAIKGYQSTPNKFLRVAELIEDIIIKSDGPSGKVIVWAYFIDNILNLETFLRGRGIESKCLYGDTPNENESTPKSVETREKIVRDFHKKDCSYKVILANPFAVGESISLHKACHNAIYLEKDFNAINYMQSKDRIHRYGLRSDDEVNYYFLLSEDSIDSVIHDRVLKKEDRMLEIIESSEIPLLQLDMSDEEIDDDDIRAIIRDYHDRKPTQAV